MKREDVPQHIRDRVAEVTTGRAQIGNNAGGWRSLSEIRALMATMFGNGPQPRRAATLRANTTPRPANTTPTAAQQPAPTEDEQLYAKAWGRPRRT